MIVIFSVKALRVVRLTRKSTIQVQSIYYLFLGLIVGQEKIEINPVKMQAVQEWPTPTSGQKVLRFLGSAIGY